MSSQHNDRNKDIRLYHASAYLDDAAGLDTMLAPIHNGDQLRAVLKPGMYSTRTQG